MARQLCISIIIDLPDGAFETADVYHKINGPWTDMREALKAAGVTHGAKVEELQVRPKVQRRPRRLRLAPVPDSAA